MTDEEKIKDLEEKVFVPTLWRCAKCGLTVARMVLDADKGAVTASKKTDTCPNECGPLWRITERELRIETQQLVTKQWYAIADAVRALQAVKRRIGFIGSPVEAMNEVNGKAVPDWSREIRLIEIALNTHGNIR